MSLLRRVIDYVDTALIRPMPAGHPPKDDLAISLGAWVGFLLMLTIFFGKSCSN